MINDLLVAPSVRPNPVESFVDILTPIPPDFPVSNLSNCVHRHRYYYNVYRNLIKIVIALKVIELPADLPKRMNYNIIDFIHVFRFLFTIIRIYGMDVPQSPILSLMHLIIQPNPKQHEHIFTSFVSIRLLCCFCT